MLSLEISSSSPLANKSKVKFLDIPGETQYVAALGYNLE